MYSISGIIHCSYLVVNYCYLANYQFLILLKSDLLKMNIRSIVAHALTIVLTFPLINFLSILMERYHVFLFTGSTIVNILYSISVSLFMLLGINIFINMTCIYFYVRNKDYIVSSTYELNLYEKSIRYLETYLIMVPTTLWIVTLLISLYILMNKG